MSSLLRNNTHPPFFEESLNSRGVWARSWYRIDVVRLTAEVGKNAKFTRSFCLMLGISMHVRLAFDFFFYVLLRY